MEFVNARMTGLILTAMTLILWMIHVHQKNATVECIIANFKKNAAVKIVHAYRLIFSILVRENIIHEHTAKDLESLVIKERVHGYPYPGDLTDHESHNLLRTLSTRLIWEENENKRRIYDQIMELLLQINRVVCCNSSKYLFVSSAKKDTEQILCKLANAIDILNG